MHLKKKNTKAKATNACFQVKASEGHIYTIWCHNKKADIPLTSHPYCVLAAHSPFFAEMSRCQQMTEDISLQQRTAKSITQLHSTMMMKPTLMNFNPTAPLNYSPNRINLPH